MEFHGLLDAAAPPEARVTAERALAYFDELRALGNADHTVLGRFAELAMTLGSWRWAGTSRGWPSRTASPSASGWTCAAAPSPSTIPRRSTTGASG